MNDENINELLNKLMSTSLNLYQTTSKPVPENWKIALSLEDQGWKIIRYEASSTKEQAIILIFGKDGAEKEVVLGYTDQQKWFDFITKRG